MTGQGKAYIDGQHLILLKIYQFKQKNPQKKMIEDHRKMVT